MKLAKFLINLLLLSAVTPFVDAKKNKKRTKKAKRSVRNFTVARAACNPLLGFLFSTLCSLIKQADLYDTLNDQDATYTVFAPTNQAFNELPSDILDAVTSDVDLLREVLLFHTVAGERKYTTKLKNGVVTTMANGGTTTTSRPKKLKIYQFGPGNDSNDLPRIILPNVGVFNGVIHGVDEVLLPAL